MWKGRGDEWPHSLLSGEATAFGKRVFVRGLLRWYGAHRRDLPFRGLCWVWHDLGSLQDMGSAEVILQQTRIEQGLPHYERFIEAGFPDVQALASSSEDEVLRVWQGLGYYSRARNLRLAARHVVQELGGCFPDSAEGWQRLRGVGPYTAAAIASFAYEERVPTVDGNVFRVVTRLFGLYDDISTMRARNKVETLLRARMPKRSPGEFNEALMEFGSLHCTPRPKCDTCPFIETCYAFAHNCISALPFKREKKPLKHRFFHYLVIHHGERLLLQQRREKDIWQNLYQPYLVEAGESKLWPALRLQAQVPLKLTPFAISNPITHLLTHQKLHLRFFHFASSSERAFLTLADNLSLFVGEWRHVPLPVVIQRYLTEFSKKPPLFP